jgi:hypothetical protein
MKNLYFIFHTVIIFLGNLPSYEGFLIYFCIENLPNVFQTISKMNGIYLRNIFHCFLVVPINISNGFPNAQCVFEDVDK